MKMKLSEVRSIVRGVLIENVQSFSTYEDIKRWIEPALKSGYTGEIQKWIVANAMGRGAYDEEGLRDILLEDLPLAAEWATMTEREREDADMDARDAAEASGDPEDYLYHRSKWLHASYTRFIGNLHMIPLPTVPV